MRRFLFAIVSASLAVATMAMEQARPAIAQQVDDRLITIPSDDVDITAAIKEARATISEFWSVFTKPAPGEKGLSLKVAITDGEKTEHIWLVNIERRGRKLFGTISNTPEWVTSVKYGQRYEFSEDDVTDWTYLRHGKIVGNRTGRALMKHMPKNEAERFLQMFE